MFEQTEQTTDINNFICYTENRSGLNSNITVKGLPVNSPMDQRMWWNKVWLLDEPFNSLDYQGKDILINLIKARCMQKGIVIITNHNQNIKIENSSEINLEDFCDE